MENGGGGEEDNEQEEHLIVMKTFSCKGPFTQGMTVKDALTGTSFPEITAKALELNPVHYPEELVISYMVDGEKRLMLTDAAFDEVPNGATVTIEVHKDRDQVHFVQALNDMLFDGNRIISEGNVPICQVIGPLCSGKSSFINTVLGAFMQYKQGRSAPLFAQPGGGSEHHTQALVDIRYHTKAFIHTNKAEEMPSLTAAPMIIRDTRGLNINITDNEKKLLDLSLAGGIGVGQVMSWKKISLLHQLAHSFFRSRRAPDVICAIWPATIDPATNGSILLAIKNAVAALAMPVPVFLIITKDDEFAAAYAVHHDNAATAAEFEKRKQSAATKLGVSADHTFVVTNVCKSSAAPRHTAYLDRKLLDIFSRVMNAGEDIRSQR